MESRDHWEHVYQTKPSSTLSWYQLEPTRSLQLIAEVAAGRTIDIIDVGGGDSTLVDALLQRDMARVTVLDISASALGRSRSRVGLRANDVTWIAADVTRAALPVAAYDVWHDRAVFHFLTSDEDQRRYVAVLERALRPGGMAIMATFALDGPARCSGLDVVRYSPETLAATLGPAFTLVRGFAEVHSTPAGGEQRFSWSVFRLAGESSVLQRRDP